MAGPISYSPPAQNLGVDVTITAGPGFALSGCTDHTGSGITAAAITGTLVLPSDECILQPDGVVWGTGSGEIEWSSGATSSWSASLVGTGSPGPFPVQLTITGGLWKGATASVPVRAIDSDGDCTTTPISSASFVSSSPFVLHPAGSTTRPPLSGATAIAAGGYHSCAVVAGGAVKCWGQNASGELGNGVFQTDSTNGFGSPLPVDVIGVIGATQVDAGVFFSCALLGGGSVKCWGENGNGQLGNGTTVDSAVPVTVSGVSGAVAIATGSNHACAIRADSTVVCWGQNQDGQLGNGTTVGSSTPVTVTGLSGATSISAGSHTCAVVSGGTVKCWGSNWEGELGNGTTAPSSTPVDVLGLSGATSISARPFHHSCAIVAGGTVQCWGSNSAGELGDGTTASALTPVTMTGVSTASAVSLSYGASCVIEGDQTVSCRGSNYFGQLGDGTTTPSTERVDVLDVTGATRLGAGYNHTCALVADGGVMCWGFNRSGQLGNGSTAEAAPPGPVIVSF